VTIFWILAVGVSHVGDGGWWMGCWAGKAWWFMAGWCVEVRWYLRCLEGWGEVAEMRGGLREYEVYERESGSIGLSMRV